MKIVIRQAGNDDAELIADFSRQTFYESFAAQNSKENMDKFLSEQFTKEGLMTEAQMHGNHFFLAYCGNELAGYVCLRETPVTDFFDGANAMEIARIYVSNKMIGKGIGKLLMAKSLQKSAELKKNIVWLDVWERNKRAINFYTNCGFAKFSEHNFKLGNDIQRDWLMKKCL